MIEKLTPDEVKEIQSMSFFDFICIIIFVAIIALVFCGNDSSRPGPRSRPYPGDYDAIEEYEEDLDDYYEQSEFYDEYYKDYSPYYRY